MSIPSDLGARVPGAARGCFLLVVLASFLACSDKKTDSSSKPDEKTSSSKPDEKTSSSKPDEKTSSSKPGDTPVAVAHSVLTAYKAQDWKRLAELSPPSWRAEEGDLAQAISKGYRKWRKVAIEAWDGNAPTTVRYGYYKGTHAENTEALVLFGSLSEREVVAVKLVREDDAWWFGKLVSPGRSQFENMPTTLEDAYKAHEEGRVPGEEEGARRRLEERKRAMERARTQALIDDLQKHVEKQKQAVELAETEADREEARRKLEFLERRLESVRARK